MKNKHECREYVLGAGTKPPCFACLHCWGDKSTDKIPDDCIKLKFKIGE